MLISTDQMGNKIVLDKAPQRIISLVPSQTELLHYWGLDQDVVGITKFCIHPKDWYRNKQRVGGTKKIDMDRIAALQPDLIIANKEENTKEEIELLQQQYPVWLSDIIELEDSWDMMLRLGKLLEVEEKATALVATLKNKFDALLAPPQRLKVAYFIWQNPYMIAANDTFIHHLLDTCGFDNAFAHQSRYPVLTAEAINAADVDIIFLSSEPFPFGEKHVAAFQELCPQAKVLVVDGELFSWYGSRLLHTADYVLELRKTLHI